VATVVTCSAVVICSAVATCSAVACSGCLHNEVENTKTWTHAHTKIEFLYYTYMQIPIFLRGGQINLMLSETDFT
jgi:hypothetical protein